MVAEGTRVQGKAKKGYKAKMAGPGVWNGEQMAVRSHQMLSSFSSGGGIKLGDVYSLDGYPSVVSRHTVGSFMRLVFARALPSAWSALSFPSPPGRPLLTSQDSAQRAFLPSVAGVVAGSSNILVRAFLNHVPDWVVLTCLCAHGSH